MLVPFFSSFNIKSKEIWNIFTKSKFSYLLLQLVHEQLNYLGSRGEIFEDKNIEDLMNEARIKNKVTADTRTEADGIASHRKNVA